MGRSKQLKAHRLVTTVSALVLMLAMGSIAGAQTQGISGIVANQPGATLLLPYFEVNLDNLAASNTIMSVTNASATAVLFHATVYTDLGVPAVVFNVYLTGYDLWRMNIGSFLTTGVMDQTASAGQDPHDTISPKGQTSQDINFASCTGLLPNGPIPSAQLTGIQNALTGQPSANYSGLCGGVNHGDRIARGYITMDTVADCTLRFPGDPGYFAAGGTGDVTNQNVLFGDSFYVSVTNSRAVAQPLVTLVANATDPATSTAGRYTFDGKYVAWTAADNRQPTSTEFAGRYFNGNSPQGLNFINQGSQAIVWRDNKTNQGPFTCPATAGARPPWYPLGQEGVVIFDEQEQPQQPTACLNPPCPPPPSFGNLFPAATQKVPLTGTTLLTSFNEGWTFLDLNTTVSGNPNPPVDPASAQAWVIFLYDQGAGSGGNNNSNSWEMGERATKLDSAENASHFNP
jgi:hypothetical protein